jgi:hypothetical protein
MGCKKVATLWGAWPMTGGRGAGGGGGLHPKVASWKGAKPVTSARRMVDFQAVRAADGAAGGGGSSGDSVLVSTVNPVGPALSLRNIPIANAATY